MVKEMRSDSNSDPFPFTKHYHIFIKFAVSFLVFGLAFRLLSSDSIWFSSSPAVQLQIPAQPDYTTLNAANQTQPPVSFDPDFPANQTQTQLTSECDLFTGDWVADPSGPFYTNRTCPEIEGHQNCMKNGRPDLDYLYWRWNPLDCDLPRFNPYKFLENMRDKSWAFIGDSISRNHVQSLLCILSQVEEANEVYHDEEYRSKIWRFPAHNFTLSVIWTPFLIKADIFEDMNGVSSSEIQLHLDQLDPKWTDQYKNYDYVVIAGGKWFLKTAIYYENNTIIGCHYCPGKNLTELGFDYAYRRALRLIFDFITLADHRPFIFFRTTTPDHFENGEWFSGGTCNRTLPFKEGEVDIRDVDASMRDIELEEFERATAATLGGADKGMILKLLDTTRLSLLRPDGHPGPYRQFEPFAKDKNAQVQNDCLHWCLPGPIDTWNDLVMEMIANHR
ncbi:protein trichome birefringence-like 25 [Mercurialis annua]|uniref:protein trichome birefringence-like 25 n=1 Tax=Mercurialis annua TaxID=3986 RepID=UPI00215EC3A0|nr:protein trichome birefringence-like 25 [Mercurialis annua]